jgi:hypothetical protein
MREIELTITGKHDPQLRQRMEHHYSQPKGFVGRSICYAVRYRGVYYGHIVGGSATKHLPGRHDYLRTEQSQLNRIVNNIFFNVAPVEGKYPLRNFTSRVVQQFVQQCSVDWKAKYGDDVLGFETLIELPRRGELYRRAGWKWTGRTQGLTCKRVAGKGSDSWSGRRVWNRDILRPKDVFCFSPHFDNDERYIDFVLGQP